MRARRAAMTSRYQASWPSDALERCVVDVDDAEALRVAVRPLEVVEQRPDEVAARPARRRRSRARRASRCASRYDDALAGRRRARCGRVVRERRAVLRDVERRTRSRVRRDEQLVQPVRIDLPAHVRVRSTPSRLDDAPARRVARVRLRRLRAVVVDAEEVERRRDRRQVARLRTGRQRSERSAPRPDSRRARRVEEPAVRSASSRRAARVVGFASRSAGTSGRG